MQQPLSSPTDEIARQYQLGMLRGTYPENKSFGNFASLIFTLVVLTVLGSILRQATLSFSWGLLLVIVMTLGALFGIISSILTLIRKYRLRNTALCLYEHGLMRLQYHDGELVHSEAIHWQDVAVVWHEVQVKQSGSGGDAGSTSELHHLYRLQRKDGTLFGGEDYKLVYDRAIATAVTQETLRNFWPETLDSYQRGLPVTFGPITITQDGIQYAERSIAWAELAKVDCSATTKQMAINMHRERAKEHGWPIQIHVPFAEIPNLHVLRKLLIFAREQQAPPHFLLFRVTSGDVIAALTPLN